VCIGLTTVKEKVQKMQTTTAIQQFGNMTGTAIVSKKGKTVGTRLTFGGQGMSASEVRKELKAAGSKGRELTREVNAVLSGEKDVRWAKFEAAVSLVRSRGDVPDLIDVRKGGATARFIAQQSPVAGVSKADAMEVLAASMGMTVEQFAAILSAKVLKPMEEIANSAKK
jgi:hypothetical protein